jgi:two-component system sensor histidine kinase NblS
MLSSFFSSENRILLAVIVLISVALLVVAFVVSNRYQSSLEEDYDRLGSLIASVVAIGGAERMMAPLSPELKVKAFLQDMLSVSPDVAAIEFYDPTGKLLFESHRNLPERDLKHALDFSAPVNLPGIHPDEDDTSSGTGWQKIPGSSRSGAAQPPHHRAHAALGTVHVKLTGKTMQDITAATKTIVLLIFASAWFISILAVSFNTYMLSKHLRTLVRGVKRLATGDFGFRISENDLWGELRVLAQSFNDMSIKLRAYEAQNLDTITFERNKLQAIFLSIADGVLVCDNAWKITIMNQSACNMLGVKSSSILAGTDIRDYVTVEGLRCFEMIIQEFEAPAASDPPHTQALQTTERSQFNDYHAHDVFWRPLEMPGIGLKVMISTILDADGERLGYVLIMHDVTKEMEVDKLKTNFISNVSHELRTPVTTIKSYVDTLYNHGDELDGETYKEFMETINLETDRLKKLVNDILDFSRLEEGAYKLEMQYQDLGPLVSLTTQSLKVLAQQKELALSTAIESSLPPIWMNADSIERVLRNLLSNAIKYTESGGRIKVRAELTGDGQFVEVTVQDTGIGIPEEHLPYIFDRFYRVENKVHTVRGTGLGLHLVKIAIENHHGGQVLAQSEVGVGSMFGFRLPVHPVIVEEAPAGNKPLESARHSLQA